MQLEVKNAKAIPRAADQTENIQSTNAWTPPGHFSWKHFSSVHALSDAQLE